MQRPAWACSLGWTRAGRLFSSPGLGWAPGAPGRLASPCRSQRGRMARDLLTRTTYVSPDEHMLLVCANACTSIYVCWSPGTSAGQSHGSCMLYHVEPCASFCSVIAIVTDRCCVVLVRAASPNQLPNPLHHLHAGPYGGFPGSFPGAPQPQPQHPMQQAPQPPQPQPQHSADPVIDPTRAGRAPSGPIGASLESRGSSSSNFVVQVCHCSALHGISPRSPDTELPPAVPCGM